MNNNLSHKALRSLMRKNYAAYVRRCFNSLYPGEKYLPNWHIEAICHFLSLIENGSIKRGMIFMPPRALKSFIVSVCWPAFLLGHNPTAKIICASYGQDLANDFSKLTSKIMGEPWYQDAFPETRLAKGRNSLSYFETDKGGYRIATSVGGVLTGRGAETIIVDDALKGEDGVSEAARRQVTNWYNNSLLTRLNNPNTGKIVNVCQRLNEDDLPGYLLEKSPSSWAVLSLQAISEEDVEIPIGDNKSYLLKRGELLHKGRFSHEGLNQLKKQIGSACFAAQYQQSPVPATGNLIPMKSFQRYETMPLRLQGDLIVQSVDWATGEKESHDYSVVTTWLYRPGYYVLINVFRDRLSYKSLIDKIASKANGFQSDLILVEQAGVGGSLVSDLRKETKLRIKGIVPKGDKVSRMRVCTADIEGGHVYLPIDAMWLADFEKECAAFPYSKHKDQVDSMSQFLNWARDGGEGQKSINVLNAGLSGIIANNLAGVQPMDVSASYERRLWNRYFGPHPNRTFKK